MPIANDVPETEDKSPRLSEEEEDSASPKGGGFATPKMPNIKIKKQYSKIYRIKTKVRDNPLSQKTVSEIPFNRRCL